MKKILLAFVWAASVYGVSAVAQNKETVKAAIDLNNVTNDKVQVTLDAPKMKSDKAVFHIPKTVPGTYSTDNYGKYIDDLKAFDSKGKALETKKTDDNSWEISGAKKLAKVTYLVNDTYDIEDEHDIFSPAGTNIDAGKNFMLNMHGFVGYFQGLDQLPYEVTITHPATLWGATSLTDDDSSDTKDLFKYSRYFEVGDHPIMYSKPDYVTFKAGDMEILLAVYSPNGAFTAESLKPELERTMQAQKKFLGNVNSTKKYAVLLYMSDMTKPDAQGFGALEHHTSTTVVFPEAMPKDQLLPALIDTVSHEFFHIVTPLTVHAEQIQYFDYADPKMSEHLWMYEGVTEYFANLFQVNQGLISEDDFFDRMAGKIDHASKMNDTMSFTQMSANVLVEPYKAQYLNVYEKGALIGMCIDIIIREKSNGQRGILDLMQKLSREYGMDKPFKDADLFGKITSLTYPEVGEFLKTYVAGTTPINYDEFFAKVGVTKSTRKVPGNVFIKGQQPLITVNPTTKEIIMIEGIEQTDFMKSLGLKGGDILVSVNGTAYNLDNIYDMLMGSQSWKEDDDITMVVKRGGTESTLKGKVKLTYEEAVGYRISDESKAQLREAWLKG
ncbi:M61 family metallopeptidase [Flavobacterium silvaticum]|uniref:Peptidase M61 n=1 Tax=Flavobacterium silvaticum TaxID=1852020 RepID=A0A972JIV3_9FLAO|nr:peptidase M61 [Flavobacterium silvaticum]NMH29445.1 peptidase M61 [Flavobacterium silvaticum]